MKRVMQISLIVAIALVSSFIYSAVASAHGYVESGRAELCKRGVNKNCGAVQYEPQSVEAFGDFPLAGPADGKLASGGVFSELDVQTDTRWNKLAMKQGLTPITWKFTANHVTENWRYYMTKPGWDPNAPLKRSDLQLISTVSGNFKQPPMSVTHLVDIPADRTGYHVILAVWEIGDTVNAFYQAIDVNIEGQAVKDEEAPTAPTNVKVERATATDVQLSWTQATDNVGVKQYDIYRDGSKVASVTGTSFTDRQVAPASAYRYTIKAFDAAGNASKEAVVDVKTAEANAPDREAPTVPTGVHSMTQTATTADVHWAPATDNVGVAKYEIYVNDELLRTSVDPTITLINLTPNTTYRVQVRAIDAAKNASSLSAVLVIKTKDSDREAPTTVTNVVANNVAATSFDLSWTAATDNEAVTRYEVYCNDQLMAQVTTTSAKVNNLAGNKEYAVTIVAFDAAGNRSAASTPIVVRTREQEVTTWQASGVYVGGQRVTHNGLLYEAKWWTQGEIPGKADVWKLLTTNVIAEWQADRAYNAGEQVTYNGVTFTAKWWTKGETPSSADVWQSKTPAASVAEWNAATVYTAGQRATYNGVVYEAKWWTRGEIPGKANVWKAL